MHPLLRLLALALALTALAGCVDEAPPEPITAPDIGPVSTAPGPNTTKTAGLQTIDVRDAGIALILGENKVMGIDVEQNATALLAELTWQDPLDDLDLYVYSPAMCADAPLTGQAPERMLCSYLDWWTYGGQHGSHVTGPEAGPGGPTYLRLLIDNATLRGEACPDPVCRWRVVVGTEVAVRASFQMAATLFYGTHIPDDFTAFADGA